MLAPLGKLRWEAVARKGEGLLMPEFQATAWSQKRACKKIILKVEKYEEDLRRLMARKAQIIRWSRNREEVLNGDAMPTLPEDAGSGGSGSSG